MGLALPASEEQLRLDQQRTLIFCDFDGTITDQDSLKWLLRRHGPANWPEIEQKMSDGLISERQVLQSIFAKMNLHWDEAKESLVNTIGFDPGFRSFMRWAMSQSLKFKILSGGFEEVIDLLLEKEGFLGIPRVANRVRATSKGWSVSLSDTPRLCDLCSHCKSWSIQKKIMDTPDSSVVYIGDGLSDICAIHLADVIFAKGSLARYCEANKMPFFEFSTFFDVKTQLETAFSRT